MSRRQAYEADPMGRNVIHWLLVTSNRAQSLPRPAAALFIGLLAAAVGLIWSAAGTSDMAAVIVAFALSAGFDWAHLWLLPRLGRSYGPDIPPALALAALRAVLVAGIGAAWSDGALTAVAVCAALSTVAFYATWVAPFKLRVTRQRLVTPLLAGGAPPVRVLHIADLHVERLTPRERRLNALIRLLRPDLIVFSGDFVNISYTYDPGALADVRAVISEWSAPLGVYCVPGTYTVEPLERVREFVHGLDNLRLLLDEWVSLDLPAGCLRLLGMVTTHRIGVDRVKVTDLADRAPDGGFRLLLTHAPDVAPEASAAGYHLYLCGHTHGGQLRLPVIGAIFTGSHLGRRFVMGRYELGAMTLYTSRGVGLEGMGAPRARLFCPPEIILWEICGPPDDRRPAV